MPLTTLARWLRRLADRIDRPRRDPFAGQPSPILFPTPTWLGLPPEQVISPSCPLDPQHVTIDVSGMPVVPYTDAERAQWRSAGLPESPNPATVLGALAPDIPRERIRELEAYCDQPVRAGDLECHECGFILPAGHGRPQRCDQCGAPTPWIPVGTFAWRDPRSDQLRQP